MIEILMDPEGKTLRDKLYAVTITLKKDFREFFVEGSAWMTETELREVPVEVRTPDIAGALGAVREAGKINNAGGTLWAEEVLQEAYGMFGKEYRGVRSEAGKELGYGLVRRFFHEANLRLILGC
jgi:hypothetical protein